MTISKRAFILAAGKGRRLLPYTETLPKPMVPVLGRPILAHTLDHLADAGITDVTINTFHKGEVIKEFVASYQGLLQITLSEEPELLDTGLGIKRALTTMQDQPFFVINGDAFWEDDSDSNVFERLDAAWAPEKMDILLLLQPVKNMIKTKGIGDYIMHPDGTLCRQKDQSGDLMFAGIRICKPELFAQTPDTPFGFLELMDQAEEKGRLYGLVHTGLWHHISTAVDLERVNAEEGATVAACS